MAMAITIAVVQQRALAPGASRHRCVDCAGFRLEIVAANQPAADVAADQPGDRDAKGRRCEGRRWSRHARPSSRKCRRRPATVAGPPASATDAGEDAEPRIDAERVRQPDAQQILQNRAEAGDGQEPDHLRAALAQQLHARAQSDGGHERHHEQIAQHDVGIHVDDAIVQRSASDRDRACRRRSRRGNIQAVEHRQPALQPAAQPRRPSAARPSTCTALIRSGRDHVRKLQYSNSTREWNAQVESRGSSIGRALRCCCAAPRSRDNYPRQPGIERSALCLPRNASDDER